MSGARLLFAAALALGITTTAQAQRPDTPQRRVAIPRMTTNAALTQPVMDNGIFGHALLDQNEGRIGGGQNAYHWEGA